MTTPAINVPIPPVIKAAAEWVRDDRADLHMASGTEASRKLPAWVSSTEPVRKSAVGTPHAKEDRHYGLTVPAPRG